MTPRYASLVLALAGGLSSVLATPGQTTAQLISIISPREGEHNWLSIPWETDLTSARQKAAAENKPIFLWEMDGHPLGCT